jgi:YD repeat-containing protein
MVGQLKLEQEQSSYFYNTANKMEKRYWLLTSIFMLLTNGAYAQVTYQYDPLHRLKKATYSNGTAITYTYDALGNRTSEVITASVLPLELLYFKANLSGKSDVLLVWQTVNEYNTRRFDIERSVDGKTFDKIGEQIALGKKDDKQNYQFLDKNLPPQYPTYFYRLRQIDNDQKFAYSKIETVVLGHAQKLSVEVYPNPNDGQFSILLLGEATSKTIDFQLIDLTGRTIWQGQTPKSTLVVRPELPDLANGLYVLIIKDGFNQFQQKIGIQR